jgi:hypothetical protein
LRDKASALFVELLGKFALEHVDRHHAHRFPEIVGCCKCELLQVLVYPEKGGLKLLGLAVGSAQFVSAETLAFALIVAWVVL